MNLSETAFISRRNSVDFSSGVINIIISLIYIAPFPSSRTISNQYIHRWTVDSMSALVLIQVHLNKLECCGKVHLFQ